ncbi:hypothetical protein BCON_0361g00090 [Botryotinia convoluta]|uniref:Uncharacterized protein n=1 Tax=Botryotinia convoluta TaxID=54673 RepID=A0A4Z1HAL9_9HELO|nr:hypothetical protein BCON_0361g00090 [Botryotinia convoluta]
MATPRERWRGSNLAGGVGDRQGAGRDWRGRDSRGYRGNRGGRWNRDDRGGRGGNIQRGGPRLCRFIEQGGHCRYGDNCTYSHDISNSNKQPNGRLADTSEQQRAREDYNSWKRLIKRSPTPNDTRTIELLWNGALTILNEGDRDWKQMLPRDLDAEENYGREHIQALLSMVSHINGHATFVALAQPFLSVITHPAMLDCLSVDTFVGGLYNFISGSNGTRAVAFFQHLCTNLVDAYYESTVSKTSVEATLITMLISLREILKREQRAAFHEELPNLINSLQNLAEAIGIDNTSPVFQVIVNQSSELRAIIARANGLLAEMEAPNIDGVSTTVVKSTYPRQIILPGGHHDNDNGDITKIKILPTEDEIRSDHPEFLPSTDFDQPYFLNDPVTRHLDTQFRLLRYDIFGELKEALGGLINAITDDPTLLDNSKLSLGDMRAYPYTKAHIGYVSFNRNRGIEARVSFNQLHTLRKKSASDRRKWWEDSKRLEEGSLLCFVSFINDKSSLLFLTVSDKRTDPKASYSLSSHDQMSTIVTKLATRNQGDLELLIQLSCQDIRGALIEFPGILLATFLPILENLQNMHRFGRLPFRQWILPDRNTISAKPLDILPPLYARGEGFLFPLDSILKANGDQLSFSPGISIDDVTSVDELEARTSLDRGQCLALMAALTREFAFIQGPPGTGKSYLGVQLMRVLLACKEKADLGPVVVVCYTNHALDQFLEHLIEIGIKKIIRIGGQSKSKTLEGKNLRIVSQGEAKTKSERYLVAKSYEQLEDKERLINTVLGSLNATQKRPDWANLKTHLQRRYPRIFSQFSRVDEDGFKIVGKEPFEIWNQGKKLKALDKSNVLDEIITTPQELVHNASQNVHSLSTLERRRLVELWVKEIHEDKTDELYEFVKDSHKIHEQLQDIHDEVDRRVLQTADVVGVTTTGLAKRISVLRRVHCKAIMCEEAGEVMEPHMISALLPSVEHFIQIGDHQQLRPQINNHGLSLESRQGTLYQLDRSQFERLSVGEPGRPSFPVAQLNIQRRMRPEISALVQRTIYPRLIDHETIKYLPDVVGMRKNVFWLNHENMEEVSDADRHQKSRSNNWEVDMTHALVRHIVRQGVYSSSDIAVLTPYTGQLQKLRTKMRSDFEIVLSDQDEEILARDGFNEDTATAEEDQTSTGNRRKPLEKKKLSEFLRIATVDNFQGEESKIIIISLVRSNKEKKVGFLRTTNRINVLLSRAQHGMYLIGNTDTYSNIPMWAQVIRMLEATDSVGKAFGLCLPRHMDTVMQASEPLDFEKLSPEGGCQLSCDRRLIECGHKCLARCHSDSMHDVFKCPQPCQRLHTPCNHSCQKQTCGEDCGLCMVKLDNIILPCNHLKDNVPCYQAQDPGSIKCNVRVQKQVPGCNHTVEAPCFQDVTNPSFRCPAACGITLACGHRCPGSCGRCNDVPRSAGDPPGLVITPVKDRAMMERIVVFVLLPARCRFDVLTPDALYAVTNLVHHVWRAVRGPASTSGHAKCPAQRLAIVCHATNIALRPSLVGTDVQEFVVKYARVDFLEMKSYGEIDVDETPVVVLGCGHFFTAESLDGHLGMSEVYEIDSYGEFTGLKDVSGALAQSIPCCPDCKCPVRQFATQRYNRVINRAIIDEMSKRFLTTGRDELQELEQRIAELERSLGITREEIMQSIRQAKTHVSSSLTPAKILQVSRILQERHTESRKLQGAIKTFCNSVADKHQPVQKLHDATVYAARKAAAATATIDVLMANLSVVDIMPALPRDRRVTMGGRMLQIKTEFFILDDKFIIAQALKFTSSKTSIKVPGGAPGLLAIPFLLSCKNFIDECKVENLPKLAIEVSLFYASIARSFESSCQSGKKDLEKAAIHIEIAKQLLDDAREVCKQPFQNSESLRNTVEESIRLMKKQWYEEVTAEEINAIKAAMVSGSQGIATHSGHWYNCENGHPFAIGECGMPMELARCPECGASVGGQNHTAVGGVTRAMNIEN